MISALHLLWIVPACGAIGFLAAAILCANDDPENDGGMF